MDTLDFLIQIFPKEILQYIIIYGISYFLLIFYGTNQWKEYSSYEKVVFPFITGGIVWIFLIYPISFFLNIFKVFDNEIIKIELNDLVPYAAKIFFAIGLYLLIYKLLFSDKPLKDNDTFFNISKIFIKIIILLFALGYYALFVAFYFSEYQEIFQLIKGSLIFSLSLISTFYLIFLESYGKLSKFDDLVLYLRLNFQKLKSMLFNNKSKIVGIAVGIILITAVFTFTGKYFLKTDRMVEEKLTGLEISNVYTGYSSIKGSFDVEQNYTITFGLIPWVKFQPNNISLVDEYGKPYPLGSNYNLSGEYVVIKSSRWNTTNVIVKGKKYENNLPKIYNINKKEFNETVQIWDINFTKPYDFDIIINDFIIAKDKQLKLIDYKTNHLFGIKPNENDNNFIFSKVELKPHEPNQSITLFFEKTANKIIANG